jgi:hypothetical protein
MIALSVLLVILVLSASALALLIAGLLLLSADSGPTPPEPRTTPDAPIRAPVPPPAAPPAAREPTVTIRYVSLLGVAQGEEEIVARARRVTRHFRGGVYTASHLERGVWVYRYVHPDHVH